MQDGTVRFTKNCCPDICEPTRRFIGLLDLNMNIDMNKQSIAVLLTCHNRINTTLECLGLLFKQTSFRKDLNASVYLVDDGSTDGTSEAVKTAFPSVNVLSGSGGLYWNQGMRVAYGAALEDTYDYYLWLNDDCKLYSDTLEKLLDTSNELYETTGSRGIVIAATKDSRTGELTYSGYRKKTSRISNIRFQMVPVSDEPVRVEGICGNCVLIPQEVSLVVGNISRHYQHRWGDIDYSLRALEKGIYSWVAPGYLADCDANPNEDRWKDRSLPLKERYSELNSLKGLGRSDWYAFVKRHGGMFWPIDWVRPYLRVLIDWVR